MTSLPSSSTASDARVVEGREDGGLQRVQRRLQVPMLR